MTPADPAPRVTDERGDEMRCDVCGKPPRNVHYCGTCGRPVCLVCGEGHECPDESTPEPWWHREHAASFTTKEVVRLKADASRLLAACEMAMMFAARAGDGANRHSPEAAMIYGQLKAIAAEIRRHDG